MERWPVVARACRAMWKSRLKTGVRNINAQVGPCRQCKVFGFYFNKTANRRITSARLCVFVAQSCSRPQGLQPARLLRPWDFPGKNTGVGCHLLQGIFPTRGSNPGLPHCRQTLPSEPQCMVIRSLHCFSWSKITLVNRDVWKKVLNAEDRKSDILTSHLFRSRILYL